jgi:DNA-damage-inducible protein D
MNSQAPQPVSPFETIRHEGEQGNEYWSARELAKMLTYNDYRNFQDVMKKAKVACQQSHQAVTNHFGDVTDMVKIGSGAERSRSDVHLSRYACYLIVQNADPEKAPVALGQTYFTIQTRRQELEDELTQLPEDQLRLVRRSQMSALNTQLAESARGTGVLKPKDFAIFQDHGYKGLYGGETARDIKTRKGLVRSQDILDWMNSDELAANAFRASLTRQKIDREQIQGKENANQAHSQMGHEVRETIKRAGATLPEEMPTPDKSIQQLQREEQKRIEQRQQPSLFQAVTETCVDARSVDNTEDL